MQNPHTLLAEDQSSDFETRKREFLKKYQTNPDMVHFSLAPDLNMADKDPRILAHEFGLSLRQVETWIPQFFEFGIWSKNTDGRISVADTSNYELSLKPQEMVMHVMRSHSLLTTGNSCLYNFISVSTNKELISKFEKELTKLTNTFYEESLKTTHRDEIYDIVYMNVKALETRKIAKLEERI